MDILIPHSRTDRSRHVTITICQTLALLLWLSGLLSFALAHAPSVSIAHNDVPHARPALVPLGQPSRAHAQLSLLLDLARKWRLLSF